VNPIARNLRFPLTPITHISADTAHSGASGGPHMASASPPGTRATCSSSSPTDSPIRSRGTSAASMARPRSSGSSATAATPPSTILSRPSSNGPMPTRPVSPTTGPSSSSAARVARVRDTGVHRQWSRRSGSGHDRLS
jgi:hypothetical protein